MLFCNQKVNFFLWQSKHIWYRFPCWSTSHRAEHYTPSLFHGPGRRKGPHVGCLGRGGQGASWPQVEGWRIQVTAGCPLRLLRCSRCCSPPVRSSGRGSPAWQRAGMPRGTRRATDARAAPSASRAATSGRWDPGIHRHPRPSRDSEATEAGRHWAPVDS